MRDDCENIGFGPGFGARLVARTKQRFGSFLLFGNVLNDPVEPGQLPIFVAFPKHRRAAHDHGNRLAIGIDCERLEGEFGFRRNRMCDGRHGFFAPAFVHELGHLGERQSVCWNAETFAQPGRDR